MSSEHPVKLSENSTLPINLKRVERVYDTKIAPNSLTNYDQTTDLPYDDITGQYLKEASSYKLLTEAEEHLLTSQLEKGRSYENNERTLKSMRLTNSGREAFNELVNHNLRLVVSIAKKYRGKGMEFDDLIGIGNEGLMRGIAKFEPDRGFKLSTYVTWWVKQSIGREIACKSRSIRLPVHYHDQLLRMTNTVKNLTQTLQREPTREEVADSLCITPSDIDWMNLDLQSPISLETPLGEGDKYDDDEFGDMVKGPEADTSKEIDKKIIQAQVRQMWSDIPNSREKVIIGLRYGFIDGSTYTLEETAQFFGLTRERIRQLENIAKSKLRKSLKIFKKDISVFD